MRRRRREGSTGGAPVITDVEDTFTRGNGTGLGVTTPSGHAWTAHVGEWGIVDNQARTMTDGVGLALATVESGRADGNVICTLMNPGGDTFNLNIVFRYVDANNYWYFRASGHLVKVFGGAGFVPLACGQPAEGAVVRINLAGAVITVFYDGVQVGTLTDADNAAGTKHGMHQGNTWSGGRWDDFKVTA